MARSQLLARSFPCSFASSFVLRSLPAGQAGRLCSLRCGSSAHSSIIPPLSAEQAGSPEKEI